MVSPSKTKHSRVAANQQQKTATASKVKLVKGPTPLVHHRFYLDVQKHQLASKIEHKIKELGGHIEFFLSKDITHFITDKDPSHYQRVGGPDPDGGPSSYNSGTPGTPLTPKTPLSNRHHQHLQQYVNEASPSSPSCGLYGAAAHSSSLHPLGSVGASGATGGGSESRPAKPAAPRSRADAMLQRARQQQQQLQQSPSVTGYNLLAGGGRTSRPCSPASPAPSPSPTPVAATTAAIRLDRNSQSPAQLAKSWGKPIWSTEYALRFLAKVNGSVKQDQHGQGQPQLGQQPPLGKGPKGESGSKTTPQHLRGDYIKIESHQRHHYRPAFALLKAWPSLNFATKSNHSPFDSARGAGAGRSVAQPAQEERPSVKTGATTNQTATTNVTTAATAKQDQPQQQTQQQQQQQQCGYCEICRIEYDVLANHLNADEHRAFVRNDGNFEALDKLIADGGVGLGSFLSGVVKKDQEEQEELTERAEDVPASESVQVQQCCDDQKDTVQGGKGECEEKKEEEEEERVVKAKKRKVENDFDEEEEEEELLIKKTIEKIVRREEQELTGQLEARKPPLKTYTRKSKEKPANPDPDTAQSKSPAKRTYAGRKTAAARGGAATAASIAPSSPPPDEVRRTEPAEKPEPPSVEPEPTTTHEEQMFGRRSAIHHHPHNTLSHHNHQKAKAARQQAAAAEAAAAVAAAAAALEPQEDGMKLQRHTAAMGMKQSQCVKSPAVAAAELMECDGLDPKNTKRISLGLRQNPKRANLNEDFTSLLDETLEPIRKPRIRRESVRRVNYSEPREDEIASQEELIESILLESTVQEAAAAVEKKKGGSPKRGSSDVKIRGIRWRAPSPQSRPAVKSPLLYKVIEDPKPKSKKNSSTSPSKETASAGSPTKATKNGLIVKIRRVRQSELSLLNDEAENFMFPKKDDSSDEDTDEDRQTSSETGPGDYSQEVPSSDYDHHSSRRKSAGTPLPTTVAVKKRPIGKATPAADSPAKRPAKESTPDPADTPRGRRVGNRGVAALLHDNAEYYKFPDPGSRLRFPEAPIQPNSDAPAAAAIEAVDEDAALMTPPPPPPPKRRGRRAAPATTVSVAAATTTSSSAAAELKQQQDLLLAARTSPEQLTSCGKAIISYKQQQQLAATGGGVKEDGMGAMFKWSTFVRNCAQIEPYRFAFERVPSLEPWYETFQRQDESSEKMYEYFGNTAYRKLPYEMGGLPPLRQNCCILNYRMKSKTPESTVPSSSASSTCDGATTTATGATSGKDPPSAKPTSSSSATDPISLPLKKRKLLVDSDRPRKSPREHASTLAILSLLQQQQQHNRRRTLSGSSATSIPLVTTANLPPPSPVAGYSPKKEAIKHQHQHQQEADSALGDEIRSSCGSDPVTEKDEPVDVPTGSGAKKIKFDPPIMPDPPSFVNYKVMCQQLEDFLDSPDVEDLELPTSPSSAVIAPSATSPLRQNLARIVQACDREPPLSLKLVSRHESIVRKIVQYDRRPRPLSAISIKSFDGGGGSSSGGGGGTICTASGTTLGIFKKRINRTGWPNVKKRIVTRKAQQQAQQQQKEKEKDRDSTGSVKKEEPVEDDPSRKSSTEESQVSEVTAETNATTTTTEGEDVKQEVSVAEEGEEEEEDDDDDDEDEFEDTMTMLDPEEVPPPPAASKTATRSNGETAKEERLLTDDEEMDDGKGKDEEREEKAKKEVEESRTTPEPTKTEEILIPSRSCPRSSLPSSKYVTKTTTTMTRVDYNHVPPTSSTTTTAVDQSKPDTSAAAAVATAATAAEECDSISSRSIFVSDDCDTTSSTLINMCAEADPLALPCTPPVDALEPCGDDGSTRSATPTLAATARVAGRRKGLQPVVCLQKINCGTSATATAASSTTTTTAASSMRTRSSSRTPIKKTYKRSVFTSALVNSSGKPLKKKRKKRKKLGLSNGGGGTASPSSPTTTVGTSSPSCSEMDQNSSSLDCGDEEEEDGDESRTDGTDSPVTAVATTTPTPAPQRGRPRNRPPMPGPIKFSPRKLRKPRGRWYRER